MKRNVVDMGLIYECNLDIRNVGNDTGTNGHFSCPPDKYCLYCCCNPQCCLLVQRRPPRPIWDAWYFWLGIALLAFFVIISVSSYIVSSCRHNLHNITLGQNVPHVNDNRDGNHFQNHEISINIIATPALLHSHRKMSLVPPQPPFTHMTPVVA
ncbi:uncharacterized protein LOC112494198 [Cephus cinctus]|uniref:Uncharacterized protein LOC112494198 n=1 Tax=Cephus cinctus TaxID=211228 RepID=A0AAJ7W0N3_CEPCN|nr:uncharacterized protein LOC112494198 [Cephus cinctus]